MDHNITLSVWDLQVVFSYCPKTEKDIRNLELKIFFIKKIKKNKKYKNKCVHETILKWVFTLSNTWGIH